MNDYWNHISRARWFSGKGRDGRLVQLTPLDWLAAPAAGRPGVRSEIATIAYPDGALEHYQLLIAYRDRSRGDDSVIGPASDPTLGTAHDATRDSEAMRLAVGALLANGETPTWDAVVNDSLDGDLTPRVFTGEQSNTNVMLGDVALLKVFRKLEPGHNLDIQVHDALGRAGVRAVARLHGWMSATVTLPGSTGTSVVDLMMLAEFLRDAEDGWGLAQESARTGGDFTAHSAMLGGALRAIHDALVDTFPTQHLSGSDIAATMIARLDTATAAAPVLAPHRDDLIALFRLLDGHRIRGQRIHGDFHLGQTLHLRGSSGGAWRIIDFEGEPMKQMWERLLPDSPWRDVAGMMRSLSYATSAHDDPLGDEAQAWLAANRRAFLGAYSDTLSEADAAVLAAYEADKAVYEVVYETRNRPDWVGIPLAGIAQLTGRPRD